MIYAIPAIDILNGQVVRLYQGHYNNVTKYAKTPIQIAKQFLRLGFSNLHIIDLMGAKTGIFTISPILEEILNLGLAVQVGGGIRTLEQAEALITKGVDRIIVSTNALANQHFLPLLLKLLGSKRVVLSLDFYKGLIATCGWKQRNGKETIASILQNYSFLENLIVTDISQDGTLSSKINCNLYRTILQEFPKINLRS